MELQLDPRLVHVASAIETIGIRLFPNDWTGDERSKGETQPSKARTELGNVKDNHTYYGRGSERVYDGIAFADSTEPVPNWQQVSERIRHLEQFVSAHQSRRETVEAIARGIFLHELWLCVKQKTDGDIFVFKPKFWRSDAWRHPFDESPECVGTKTRNSDNRWALAVWRNLFEKVLGSFFEVWEAREVNDSPDKLLLKWHAQWTPLALRAKESQNPKPSHHSKGEADNQTSPISMPASSKRGRPKDFKDDEIILNFAKFARVIRPEDNLDTWAVEFAIDWLLKQGAIESPEHYSDRKGSSGESPRDKAVDRLRKPVGKWLKEQI